LNLRNSLAVALRALRANKLRSALTMLGLIIGVAAVVGLMSIGRGAQEAITSQIGGLGSNLIVIHPGASMLEMEAAVYGGTEISLTLEDAEAIADPHNAPAVTAAVPEATIFGKAVASDQDMFTMITGTTPEYEQVRNSSVAYGEFFSQRHVEGQSMVCLLGSHAAEYLFQGSNPLGHSVRIDKHRFTVIGVLEKKGGMGMAALLDDVVMIPISTLHHRLSGQRLAGGERGVQTINAQAVDEQHIDAAIEQITTILRKRHNLRADEVDDFTIVSQQEIQGVMRQVTDVFTIFLGAVAGISLLVGGIGIMNIMLVSVTERTREIGIRKAVGARRRDILIQFLIESAVLSLSGGTVGLLLGWGASQMISRLSIGDPPIRAVVSPDIVILAFSVAVAIGLFFGIYPATRAARLNPIDALRYE
jgi:putative ABC transport system permease protein